MRLIGMLFMMLLISGCTKGVKPLCEIGKLGTEVLADQVATQLSCKNKTAIKATMDQKLVDLKVCEQPNSATSVIGDIVCPRLIPGLMGIITNKIPAEWECSGGDLKDGLQDYLLKACKDNI